MVYLTSDLRASKPCAKNCLLMGQTRLASHGKSSCLTVLQASLHTPVGQNCSKWPLRRMQIEDGDVESFSIHRPSKLLPCARFWATGILQEPFQIHAIVQLNTYVYDVPYNSCHDFAIKKHTSPCTILTVYRAPMKSMWQREKLKTSWSELQHLPSDSGKIWVLQRVFLW